MPRGDATFIGYCPNCDGNFLMETQDKAHLCDRCGYYRSPEQVYMDENGQAHPQDMSRQANPTEPNPQIIEEAQYIKDTQPTDDPWTDMGDNGVCSGCGLGLQIGDGGACPNCSKLVGKEQMATSPSNMGYDVNKIGHEAGEPHIHFDELEGELNDVGPICPMCGSDDAYPSDLHPTETHRCNGCGEYFTPGSSSWKTGSSPAMPSMTQRCQHCGQAIVQDTLGWWIDDTGGDVCGVRADGCPHCGDNEETHEPSHPQDMRFGNTVAMCPACGVEPATHHLRIRDEAGNAFVDVDRCEACGLLDASQHVPTGRPIEFTHRISQDLDPELIAKKRKKNPQHNDASTGGHDEGFPPDASGSPPATVTVGAKHPQDMSSEFHVPTCPFCKSDNWDWYHNDFAHCKDCGGSFEVNPDTNEVRFSARKKKRKKHHVSACICHYGGVCGPACQYACHTGCNCDSEHTDASSAESSNSGSGPGGDTSGGSTPGSS